MTDLTAAIEAAARARVVRWGYDKTLDQGQRDALVAQYAEDFNLRADVEAAAPLIRAQVAEEIAVAIEGQIATMVYDGYSPEDDAILGLMDGARHARERATTPAEEANLR